MRSRGLALVVLLSGLTLSTMAPAAAPVKLRVLSCDLSTATVNYQQLASLLLYLQPDIVALQGLRDTAVGLPTETTTATLGRSLRMYYAYEPMTPEAPVGCSLLSRYPIRRHSPLPGTAKRPLPGMRAQLAIGDRRLTVLLARPRSAAENAVAADIISALAKRDQKSEHLLVMAAFDAGAAMETVKAWGRAGLQDAAVVLGKAAPTFPAARPTERLDYMVISASLRPSLKGMQVIGGQRVKGLGQHLPVELTLAY